ncbi:unnamed protein product [Clonostachys rosea]|uniref:Autophagy-related protein 13 n=1 Tax=Bionectria ochroleuca TaxID=29856 RepID=A0ABY6UU29_BIOOC|nr:unnamed protein product [Clonostachys rosea]
MHQQPRVPPRVSSPTASPQLNQYRNNASRESAMGASRSRAGSTVSGRDVVASPTLEIPQSPLQMLPAESVKKLDQIIQVATLVIDSRIKVKPTRNANSQRKTSKWVSSLHNYNSEGDFCANRPFKFQIETDEFEDFKEELKTWKPTGNLETLPPPLTLEIYLDTSSLKDSQSLTIVDEDGKRWDVMEQLNAADISTGSRSSSTPGKITEVILERWRVELEPNGSFPTDDFGPILPTVYKKAIVFFRSLFTATRLFPAWKFASQGLARNSIPALIPRCRIRPFEGLAASPDLLRYPIMGRSEPVTDYVFGDLETPVGRLKTSVTYRNDCSFRVDDSEALLSSRFMGIDEDFFKPSLTQRNRGDGQQQTVQVGSLQSDRPEPLSNIGQTYGSLSTFHGGAPLGTSPISALKAVKSPGSASSSPPASFSPQPGIEPPNSLPITSHASAARPGRKGDNEHGRRPSISFQPFKAGSLSGSPIPRQGDGEPFASSHTSSRLSGVPSLSQPRNRTSLTAGMPASLRGGPPPQSSEPLGSSPRTNSGSRYSSSFTHRRGRLSISSANRPVDDEQGSSGRQSLASSVVQPGSGLLAEPGTSSGSLQAEEDNISDFLKAIDSKRTLKSFETTKRGESATNRTVAQLSRFHLMKDSNAALTDSMTSSIQMQRSSSSSSRQLASVPGVSMSASSSPSKPHSPHTPHTPAIPSRLSENSVADNSSHGRLPSRNRRPSETVVPESSRESTIRQEGTNAIDIPLSPRLGAYQRRSSSVAQQTRAVIEDDADLPFAAANRSISLGADDREPPTISRLLGRQLEAEAAEQQIGTDVLEAAAEIQPTEGGARITRDSADDNPSDGFMASSPYGRRRYTGMMSTQHRQTPPQSSRGSFNGSSTRLAREDNESIGDEPLVFDLSEMDAQSRRSLEEGRGGGQVGSDRGGAESRGASRRGW